MMTKQEILKKCKALAKQGMNTTEMTIALVDKGENPRHFLGAEYNKIIHTINDLKREGKL